MYGTADTTVEVFCSYAPQDKAYFEQLEKHLRPLKRQGLISLWHYQGITPGENQAHTIDRYLKSTSVIILLISPDFLASDCCIVEMQRAVERHEAGEAQVIPVVVRHCDWRGSPVASLQVLPRNAKPISACKSTDKAWKQVAADLRCVIEDLLHLTPNASETSLPSTWMIPYSHNPFFLGRDELLFQIHSQFQAGQPTARPQAISGLGGIGKTQIAVEYAYCYFQEYQRVLWVRAESVETLNSSYVQIAAELKLLKPEAQEQEIVIQAVKAWLQRHDKWLLIFDNADDPNLLLNFFPTSTRGHILVTTRASDLSALGLGFSHSVEVETFPPEQGALFLLRRAGLVSLKADLDQATAQDRTLAQQISQELGGLPLALDQAGVYIKRTRRDLDTYLRIYRQDRVQLFRERRGRDHPEPVVTTWSPSFQQVEKKNPAAAALLRLCAYLSPDDIPEDILTRGAPYLGPLLEPVAADALLLDQAIEALRDYSLLGCDPRTRALSVHRLVQGGVRDALPTEEQTAWIQRAVLAVNAASPNWQDVTQRSACERWLPHALACARWIVEQEQMEFPLEVTYPLNSLANLYSELGKYREAEPLCRRCLDIREQRLGRDHPDVAPLLNNLAILCKVQGKYKEAEELYQHSLHIWEQSLGPEHPNVAQSLNNLAVLYAELGRYEEAKELFERSLRIRERVLGPEHLDVAQSLSHLANLYTEQGKYVEAEQSYQRSLHIFKQNRGPEHPDVAYLLNGLGILYKVQGRYVEAEQSYLHSRNIWEQILGSEHPQVAYSLHNLAVLYTKQGKYEKAEELFKRSLHIWKQNLGPEHLHTQTCAKNYAGLLHILKRTADAQELEREYFFSEEVIDELLLVESYLRFYFGELSRI